MLENAAEHLGGDLDIGHGAVLHGCVVRRNALVGMNAVINDSAEIGESSIVAAMAFVKARIGSVKTPKEVHIWNELPRSKVGKVLKKDVRAELLKSRSG